MKLIVEANDRVTVLDSSGNTAMVLTEAGGTITVEPNTDENVNVNGLAGGTKEAPTLQERAFDLIERHTSDDQTRSERREASKQIARELFGAATKKNLQRVAAYKASLTRQQQA